MSGYRRSEKIPVRKAVVVAWGQMRTSTLPDTYATMPNSRLAVCMNRLQFDFMNNILSSLLRLRREI